MPRAAADAERFYQRITKAAPIAGQKWYNGLISSLDSLSGSGLVSVSACLKVPDEQCSNADGDQCNFQGTVDKGKCRPKAK